MARAEARGGASARNAEPSGTAAEAIRGDRTFLSGLPIAIALPVGLMALSWPCGYGGVLAEH